MQARNAAARGAAEPAHKAGLPKWWCTAACVAVLGACAGAPGALPAPAPLAAAPAWQAPLPAAAAALGEDIWSRFDDPLLGALVGAAQQAGAGVSAAAARIEQARAVRVAAAARLQPEFDASASVTQGRSLPATPASSTLAGGVQAAWEIDLFGGARAAADAAQARLEAAQIALQGARVAVAAETATTYVALRACEALAEQTRLDSTSRAETARLTDALAKAGFRAPADAALARASAAQGRALAVQQQAACDALVKSLVALTAIDEPALRERLRAGVARLPPGAPVALASVPAALLQQRPDLAAASRQVSAAAADHAERTAARWPQVSLAGSVGAMRIATSGATTTSGSTWSLGPLTLTVPLFDSGRRAADVDAARAAYEDALRQLQAGLRNAVREVEDALVRLQSAATRSDDARIAAEGFAESLGATEARWKAGAASLFELEDARRSAVAARMALIDLDRERLVAWIDLYRALGGGWSDAAPQARNE